MAFVSSTTTVSVGDITKVSDWLENKQNTNFLHDDILGVNGDTGTKLGESGGPGASGAIRIAAAELFNTVLTASANTDQIGIEASTAGGATGPYVVLYGASHSTDAGRLRIASGGSGLASGGADMKVGIYEHSSSGQTGVALFDVLSGNPTWHHYGTEIRRTATSTLSIIPSANGWGSGVSGLQLNGSSGQQHVLRCAASGGLLSVQNSAGTAGHIFSDSGNFDHRYAGNAYIAGDAATQTVRLYNSGVSTRILLDADGEAVTIGNQGASDYVIIRDATPSTGQVCFGGTGTGNPGIGGTAGSVLFFLAGNDSYIDASLAGASLALPNDSRSDGTLSRPNGSIWYDGTNIWAKTPGSGATIIL